jgi:glycosyltransferase involved in cell wall biosynthesis
MYPQSAPAFAPSLPHRLWRRLPAGPRREALAKVTGWLAPKPWSGPVQPGIAIVGELSRPSGLGEGARIMAEAARRARLPVWTIDLSPPAGQGVDVAIVAPPEGVPLVLHVNAPLLPLALLRLPRAVTRRRPIIGYWAWELPEVPADWVPGAACVSEVWTPSRFTASALEPLLPTKVRVVPPALALIEPVPSGRDRASFGLPEDAVVVLVSFSLASSCARKNPFAAIAAFRAAFGDRTDRVLVLKIGGADHAPGDFSRIAAMVEGAPNIRLETGALSSGDRHALMACADIVLSLHHAEGFGLVMAEAMALGKAVVATGWSGNTDFMDTDCAVLVPNHMAPARDDRAVYHGTWAEPDVMAAAVALHRLADHPAERSRLGAAGRARVRDLLTEAPLLAALEGLR